MTESVWFIELLHPFSSVIETIVNNVEIIGENPNAWFEIILFPKESIKKYEIIFPSFTSTVYVEDMGLITFILILEESYMQIGDSILKFISIWLFWLISILSENVQEFKSVMV